MVIRKKRRTLFWVNNDPKTYTRIRFSIHDYKSQLMDMGAAQSKCNLHETLATLRGSPPPKVVQGENRYFSENSSTALGMRHRNPRYCNGRTSSSRAYLLKRYVRYGLHCTEQRNFQSRQNQLPPIRHYVHFAPTPPTNCTSRDKLPN